jgi:hypothetical protein
MASASAANAALPASTEMEARLARIEETLTRLAQASAPAPAPSGKSARKSP